MMSASQPESQPEQASEVGSGGADTECLGMGRPYLLKEGG